MDNGSLDPLPKRRRGQAGTGTGHPSRSVRGVLSLRVRLVRASVARLNSQLLAEKCRLLRARHVQLDKQELRKLLFRELDQLRAEGDEDQEMSTQEGW